jgi:hypothetical protein
MSDWISRTISASTFLHSSGGGFLLTVDFTELAVASSTILKYAVRFMNEEQLPVEYLQSAIRQFLSSGLSNRMPFTHHHNPAKRTVLGARSPLSPDSHLSHSHLRPTDRKPALQAYTTAPGSGSAMLSGTCRLHLLEGGPGFRGTKSYAERGGVSWLRGGYRVCPSDKIDRCGGRRRSLLILCPESTVRHAWMLTGGVF